MFLVHRVPFPPNRGDRIRSYHILKFLAGRANVSLATLADEPLEPGTREALKALSSRVAVEPVGRTRWLRAAVSVACGQSATEGLFCSPNLRQTIRCWSRETPWDAVVVFCSSMVQYLDVSGVSDAPVLVDLVDVDSQKFFDYAEHARGMKKWLYQLEGRRLRRLECSLPGRVKAIALVSEAEAELYRTFCPNDRTFAIPNGVDLDYFRPENDGSNPWTPLSAADKTNLVFVGALDYHANIDGIVWFAHEVWPLVRRDLPSITLGLVGRNPVLAIRKLAEIPGIRVVGSVADVRPHLAAADIAIAPLRIARGIQNKILEAMAMAKPVVCSPATGGLHAVDGREIVVAKDPQSWMQSIRDLYNDPFAASRIGQSGYLYAKRCHSWSELQRRWPLRLDGRRTGVALPQTVHSRIAGSPPAQIAGSASVT